MGDSMYSSESVFVSGGVPVRGRPALQRWPQAVLRALGLRQTIEIEGVRYRERSVEPLRRALSRRGRGFKEFDVRFASGERMRIRATAWRAYADLMDPPAQSVYAAAGSLVRPGMRVLDAACGTGFGAAWLVERVGPSGAVVALTRDRESARYARERYPAPNIAFEHGWTDALSGEVDGSFDAVFACAALTPRDDAPNIVREWWRLVGANGWLLLAAPEREPEPAPNTGEPDAPRCFSPDELAAFVRSACGGDGAEDLIPSIPDPAPASQDRPSERPGLREHTVKPVPMSASAVPFSAVIAMKRSPEPETRG